MSAAPRILAFGALVAIVGMVVLTVNPLWGVVVLLFDLVVVMSALFTTPNSIAAWQTGAEGKFRTGRLLEPLEADGFKILHDRKIPSSRANIDHIVIGPPGIFVIETESYAGSLKIRGDDDFVAGRRKTGMIDEMKREASAVTTALADEIAARGWTVIPLICVHRADLPWFRSQVGGVRIVSGEELVKRLRKVERVLTPADCERLAVLAAARLRPGVHRSQNPGVGPVTRVDLAGGLRPSVVTAGVGANRLIDTMTTSWVSRSLRVLLIHPSSPGPTTPTSARRCCC